MGYKLIIKIKGSNPLKLFSQVGKTVLIREYFALSQPIHSLNLCSTLANAYGMLSFQFRKRHILWNFHSLCHLSSIEVLNY